MPGRPTLQALRRTVVGKQVKRLRRDGFVPGVVYGPVLERPVPIMVERQSFERVYQSVGTTSLVDLQVDDSTYSVFAREADRHPVSRNFLNIEFYAPDQRQPIGALVPLVTVGELPFGTGGVAVLTRSEIEVRALPGQVPNHIEVDLRRLSGNRASLRAGDLLLPEGVELVTPVEEVILVVEEPTSSEGAAAPQQVLSEQIGDRPAAVDQGAGPIEEE